MRNDHIQVLEPAQEPVLAGRLDGKRAFVRFLQALSAFDTASVVILDFRGAELATSSFLDEAVVHFRDHLRLGRSPSYLVVANLAEKIAEELEGLLARAGDALWCCDISGDGEITNPRLLGRLDPKLKETFDLVVEKGETSAVELHSQSVEAGIGTTAWNNRLSALAAKSVLMEIPAGRTKKYRPILEAA